MHTPGPWALDANGWCCAGEVWENQALIAAAPDLLAVLEAIEMETRKGGQWTAAEINEIARAAIKKAKGEA